jgi:hypothetical protein
MGFAGYVAVCVCQIAARNRLTTTKGKQTNTRKRYSKINEENRTTKKHRWKRAKGNHVQVKPAKQFPSGIRK